MLHLQNQCCGTTRGLCIMQINVHTMWKKSTHHLYKTTKPRIHAIKNTHTLRCTVATKLFSQNTILANGHRHIIRRKYQQDIKQLLTKV